MKWKGLMFGWALVLYSGTAAFDQGTTIYYQRTGQVREVGPMRSTPIRVASAALLGIGYQKLERKSQVIRWGLPLLFLAEGVHTMHEARKVKR